MYIPSLKRKKDGVQRKGKRKRINKEGKTVRLPDDAFIKQKKGCRRRKGRLKYTRKNTGIILKKYREIQGEGMEKRKDARTWIQIRCLKIYRIWYKITKKTGKMD